MVASQKIHAGMIHAGKLATVICENSHFLAVIDGETATVVPVPPPAKPTATKPTPPASDIRPGLPARTVILGDGELLSAHDRGSVAS
jgi:hypothetical protein